ncbi:hypothetical protein [Novosphingobium album (ex Liu et al. 2023)]|uniref:Uncharacterized protein n=1 Tax=Novosphingobium album (ex Liu et al. 2023) TaxID=3031130 RepID=A0ABT5WVH9_9SPHN|nr:hypothetical protein [Novosphingobium album (ex Liu et al. 2023)]MDE8653849.1 hypothetical protein [Novosphingobium album (ex Liu et al. 2023)]
MRYDGGTADPMAWVIKWLSIVLSVATTFVATPQIHGATYDWAIGYMADNYGTWLAAIGGFFWWIIVAMLTFLFSTLFFMTLIMLGRLLVAMAGSGAR